MTTAGELTRRVTFQRRGLDDRGRRSPNEPWEAIVTRDAKVAPRTGGEGVVNQRLEGRQPVVIYVRRDSLTKTVDNGDRALDARDDSIVWNIASAIWNEADDMMEFLAVQRRNGSDA